MNEAVPEPAAEPAKKRSGWWFLAKLVGALLVLTIGTLWLWVRSDGDLRAARERIAAAGFPTSGPEMGRKKSDETRIAAWKRLDVLFQNNKAPLGAWYNEPPGLAVPGSPMPETLNTHLAAFSPAAVEEAGALFDGLGDEPMVLDESFTMATRVVHSSRANNFLFYRALSATVVDLPKALRRLARIPRLYPPESTLFHHQMHSLLMRALLYRRSDLAAEPREQMADTLLEVTADPGRRLAQTQVGALVVQLDFFINPDERMRGGGMMAPDLFQWPVIGSLLLRAGRGAFL